MGELTKVVFTIVLALAASRPVVLSGAVARPDLKEQMTAAEFERAGLHKLTPAELGALESWLAVKYAGSRTAASSSLGDLAPAHPTELVAFNRSNGKYHCASCQWALRCTRNCVKIPLAEARARGVACKVCGGSCN